MGSYRKFVTDAPLFNAAYLELSAPVGGLNSRLAALSTDNSISATLGGDVQPITPYLLNSGAARCQQLQTCCTQQLAARTRPFHHAAIAIKGEGGLRARGILRPQHR